MALHPTLPTGKVVALTDTAIAYDRRKEPEFKVTFDDLDHAIDIIQELIRKYVLLFTGASTLLMTPVETKNARSVFTFAWIDPDKRPDLGESI